MRRSRSEETAYDLCLRFFYLLLSTTLANNQVIIICVMQIHGMQVTQVITLLRVYKNNNMLYC